MRTLFIASTSSCAGKTTIGLCLALNFKGRIGYFKPLSANEDTQLFRKVLGLKPPAEKLSLEEGGDLTRRVAELDPADLLLVEGGPNLSYGAYKGLSSPDIARELKLNPIVVAVGSSETVIDKLMLAKSCFSQIQGVILNKVPRSRMSEAESFTIPLIEKMGLPVLGVVPSYRELRVVRAREVLAHLGAEVVCGEGLDRGIDAVLVGAMSADAALKQFRRYSDKVVITGGDRADIMLAAMETSTSCIVATGGVRPPPPVVKRAVELRIPVFLVEGHTYAAAKRVEEIEPVIRVEDIEKLEVIRERVSRHVKVEAILG